MAVELKYKHQQKTYELMQKELKKSKRAAYEFPTGCGKSFPALKYVEENPDKPALIISPSTAINNQFKRYIETYVENGKKRIKDKNIAIVTYQKVALLAKLAKKLKAGIIIIDELHRMGADTWEPAIDELIESQPDVEVIAMTATPKRTDQRNMAEEKFGEHIVYEMSLTEALSGEKEDEVILRSPRYVRVLSQVRQFLEEYKDEILLLDEEKQKGGRYKRLEEITSSAPGIQEVLETGMRKKNGKYLVFCKDREDLKQKMEQAQELFERVNTKIKSEYVITKKDKDDEFGKTDSQNRKTLERFEGAEESDELQLLFCVDKLNEGVHIEGIDGEILFDLTKSPVLYKQRIGRVTTPDRETVIIDVANNWLNHVETYLEIERAIREGQKRGEKEPTEYDDNDSRLTPEETELLELLKEMGEIIPYSTRSAYEELIEWLETHDGKMPDGQKSENGKVKRVEEMPQEEHDEVILYARWIRSPERKILEEYEEVPLEEVPEEYREKISILRSYGLGITTYEEIIKWLETHDGQMPNASKSEGGKTKSREKMTEEEKEEVNLYNRWLRSPEQKILVEYEERPIEEVPEEYREKISILRGYGLGLKKKTTYEEIIEWLEMHDGQMVKVREDGNLYARWRKSKERNILNEYAGRPIEEVPEEYREKISILRSYGLGLKKKTTYEEITEWLETHEGKMPSGASDEKEEANLYDRWTDCPERKILVEYEERPIEEVPEEYREKIIILRSYGLGFKKKTKYTVYEEIIEWLETHDGQMASAKVKGNDGYKKRGEMTEEEKGDAKLYGRWRNSKEKNILDEYAGRPIEEVPEEYREKISILRSYGLGLKKNTPYEEIIEWLEIHNGQMPSKKEDLNLCARWRNSKERNILDEYAGKPIEEVPEEYREKIAKLRSLGQMGKKKDDRIKTRMKNAVGNAVAENETTREELLEERRNRDKLKNKEVKKWR